MAPDGSMTVQELVSTLLSIAAENEAKVGVAGHFTVLVNGPAGCCIVSTVPNKDVAGQVKMFGRLVED